MNIYFKIGNWPIFIIPHPCILEVERWGIILYEVERMRHYDKSVLRLLDACKRTLCGNETKSLCRII